MLRIDNDRPRRRARVASRVLVAAIAILALAGAGTAAAASSVEGIWSFKGGEIAVQPLSNGTFVGTVVEETKFAECTHPAGQQIWSGMTLQPDGSYWGLHQWYESPGCTIEPTLGPTVWRVDVASDGSHYLHVCFSSPGTSQPKIAPDGSEQEVTYGCTDSARIAALPPAAVGTLSFVSLASLPSPKACLSRRSFQIHIRDPKHDAFKTVSVTIRGHRLTVARRGAFTVATVDLRGLPRGAFTVLIKGTTVLGRRLSGQRTYHTCTKKRVPAKRRRARKS
jgi:hypothetical protein